jgi:hypothetical protein
LKLPAIGGQKQMSFEVTTHWWQKKMSLEVTFHWDGKEKSHLQ